LVDEGERLGEFGGIGQFEAHLRSRHRTASERFGTAQPNQARDEVFAKHLAKPVG